MDANISKVAIAAFLHDMGKFAERAKMPMVDTFFDGNAFYLPKNSKGYETHIHALYTAAFIDHIEKLLPKEFNRGDWGLEDPLINLAAGHHNPGTPLQWVVAMADRVASGFDRDEFEEYNKGINIRDYRKTRLLTPFEGIDINDEKKADSLDFYKYRHHLKELKASDLFPVRKEEVEPAGNDPVVEYKELFNNFIFSLEKLKHRKHVSLWLEHFDSLFMVYASNIPAATVGRVVPDVSLYDHSRITAALASAIYLYHSGKGQMSEEKIRDYDDKKMLIVSGDFFGIQDFIFAEGGSTRRNAAKLLRGRSFAVSLMAELAADMLCSEIGLTPLSVVLNAAGKFTLIAPNTEDAKERVRETETAINDWLAKYFYGEASFGAALTEASYNDFTTKEDRFLLLMDRTAKGLERKKCARIDLERHGGAVKGYLDEFNNEIQGDKLCPYCGRRPSKKGKEDDKYLKKKSACSICRDHIYLGSSIVQSAKLAVFSENANIHGDRLLEPIFGRYQVSMEVDGNLSESAAEGSLVKYWDISNSEDGKIEKEITAKFINSHVPVCRDEDFNDKNLELLAGSRKSDARRNELFDTMESGLPKTFHHLAVMARKIKNEKACGIEALGVFKADVDNLGSVFSCGLRRASISRIAMLSRRLNLFFSVYLPYVLKTNGSFRDIYTVFSGGDDLFLIGPWNRIIELAGFIQEEFSRYVCNNRQITISAGISLNKPGEPVHTIADMAEKALKKAKENGRDSITLFSETIKWQEFRDLEDIKAQLEEWLGNGTMNNAMLFRLNFFSDMAKQEKSILRNSEIADDDWECFSWRSKFKYATVRNCAKELKGEEKSRAISDVEKASGWISNYSGALKIPVWRILYENR